MGRGEHRDTSAHVVQRELEFQDKQPELDRPCLGDNLGHNLQVQPLAGGRALVQDSILDSHMERMTCLAIALVFLFFLFFFLQGLLSVKILPKVYSQNGFIVLSKSQKKKVPDVSFESESIARLLAAIGRV